LCEKLADAAEFFGQHKGLVAVITGPNITGCKGPGHGQLRYFLAISKNPKFCLTGEHLFSANQARLSADPCDSVIRKNFFLKFLKI